MLLMGGGSKFQNTFFSYILVNLDLRLWWVNNSRKRFVCHFRQFGTVFSSDMANIFQTTPSPHPDPISNHVVYVYFAQISSFGTFPGCTPAHAVCTPAHTACTPAHTEVKSKIKLISAEAEALASAWLCWAWQYHWWCITESHGTNTWPTLERPLPLTWAC